MGTCPDVVRTLCRPSGSAHPVNGTILAHPHAMSGTLFVVATPIGNLEDVTLRAVRVLGEVDLIAAEDTRRTARLLAHLGIATPSISFHQHNARARLPQILSRLLSGQRVALVTDAGTPGVSDPGAELVAACVEAHIAIDTIPGVSAPLAVAVASGFPLIPLCVFGFPPRRAKARIEWLASISGIEHTLTFFESPLRVASTLDEAATLWGNRQICVGREVTKIHQEFIRGTAAEASERLRHAKGEITVVVGPKAAEAMSIDPAAEAQTEANAVDYFGRLIESTGLSRRQALTEAARKFRLSSGVLYAAIEKSKNSVL